MGILPPTGSQISMGRTAQAYYNWGNGSGSVSFAAGVATLTLLPSIGLGTQYAPLSQVFGGRSTPYNY
jgi:hypothetical protein